MLHSLVPLEGKIFPKTDTQKELYHQKYSIRPRLTKYTITLNNNKIKPTNSIQEADIFPIVVFYKWQVNIMAHNFGNDLATLYIKES